MTFRSGSKITGQIADDPARDMAELRRKIDADFVSLTSDTWTNAYAHAQKFEKVYMEIADECELQLEDDESDGDNDEDGSDND
ncbi:hypothetical protein ON010_g4612 [Phytophthora cinnamomi]|nr:hypothetical protein ON010_g4612 [Phytophthora cinnamomi]